MDSTDQVIIIRVRARSAKCARSCLELRHRAVCAPLTLNACCFVGEPTGLTIEARGLHAAVGERASRTGAAGVRSRVNKVAGGTWLDTNGYGWYPYDDT